MEEKLVEIKSMFDTTELNRLQRCAKNKDKKEIEKWGQDIENRLNQYYYEKYKAKYLEWLNETLMDMEIAMCYVLHFNENTRFGNKRLESYLNDMAEVIRGFYRKDFSREEYKKQLEEDGIKFTPDFKKI